MNELFYSEPQCVCYESNCNDAYIPEHWSMESLAILEEEMVMANLVHRDFSSQLAQWGDVVNTRRPRKFEADRKTDCDKVEACPAKSDNVRVPLDQHHYKTFVIKDAEMCLSMKDLIKVYLKPAMQAVARNVDRSITGQAFRFKDSAVGTLGGLNAANARQQIVEANCCLKEKNVPDSELSLILDPQAKAAILNSDIFVAVDQSGRDNALRRAEIGNLFGFDIFCVNNTACSEKKRADFAEGTVTDAQAKCTTATAAPVTLTGYEVNVGEFATIEGSESCQYITAATTGGGDTTDVTLDSETRFDTLAGAALTVYQAKQTAAAYEAGYQKRLDITGGTNPLQQGQLLATGTGPTRVTYTVISVRTDGVLLDRPLESALVLGENVFPGPGGCFNLAFHRDAIAFVNRPLCLPPAGSGAASSVQTINDLSIRVTMQYDSECQGTRVTCDMLSGVALLDEDMGCLFYG